MLRPQRTGSKTFQRSSRGLAEEGTYHLLDEGKKRWRKITKKPNFRAIFSGNGQPGGSTSMFSWDLEQKRLCLAEFSSECTKNRLRGY